jgi:hypothetical protein
MVQDLEATSHGLGWHLICILPHDLLARVNCLHCHGASSSRTKRLDISIGRSRVVRPRTWLIQRATPVLITSKLANDSRKIIIRNSRDGCASGWRRIRSREGIASSRNTHDSSFVPAKFVSLQFCVATAESNACRCDLLSYNSAFLYR